MLTIGISRLIMRIVSLKVIPIKINVGREKSHKPLLLWDFLNGILFEPKHSDSLVEATLWRSKRCWDPAWSRLLFVLLLAVLFSASPPARICKPVHSWKHSQQRVGPWNHSGIRWVWVKWPMLINILRIQFSDLICIHTESANMLYCSKFEG